jgi:secreted trypsin-like serine protease
MTVHAPSSMRRRRFRGGLLLVLPVLVLGVLAAGPVSASGPDQRIIGGTPVPAGKYPFQAALLGQTFGSDDWARQFCGGSLIGPDTVLTAAHCVDFIGSGPDAELNIRDFRVVVGRTVLTTHQGQKRHVTSIAIHPRWDPSTGQFDAAVVTLDAPIKGITPIKLVTPGTDALQRPGRRVLAIGWGNVIQQPFGPGPGGIHYPHRLREVWVPLVSKSECVTAYAHDGTSDVDPVTMICAGRTNKDTCQGDSGGPLFVPASGGGYIEIGITSSGNGCGATGYPGIYTKLSNLSIGNFIQEAAGGAPV